MKAKSPLRYPGGKSKAIKRILPLIPTFSEYREPFVGGGSVFLSIKQIYSNAKYIINDLNQDLISFWQQVRDDETFYDVIKQIKDTYTNGRELWETYRQMDTDMGVRYFILNRLTFSGLVDAGGYSGTDRFNDSSIQYIKDCRKILQNVEIYNKDYRDIIFNGGKDVFIFLDPPYYRQVNSRLYGKKGILHTSFNHKQFAEDMKQCRHKWLITLDDTKEIRDWFSFANIKEWDYQYGMNSFTGKCTMGKELFISNY